MVFLVVSDPIIDIGDGNDGATSASTTPQPTGELDDSDNGRDPREDCAWGRRQACERDSSQGDAKTPRR